MTSRPVTRARFAGMSLEHFGTLLLNFNFVLDCHLTLVARNLDYSTLWLAQTPKSASGEEC